MNAFRLLGDMTHLASIFILLAKITKTRSCTGISFKTQALYLLVFLTRYVDLFFRFYSAYNSAMKVFFIASSAYFLYLMKRKFKATWDPTLDSFRWEFLVAGAAIFGLVTTQRFDLVEILWTFSIWLESVAIVPQITLLSRTGVDTRITVYYLFALGIYRAFYILNWMFRWANNQHIEWVSVIAGNIQTIVYANFFYTFYTKVTKGPKYNLPQ